MTGKDAMAENDHRAGVRAVKALTRFHYAGAERRTFSRAAASDRKRSGSWGWHENVVGIGVSWKRVGKSMVPGQYCLTFFVLRKEPKRRLLHRQRIPAQLELDSAAASIVTDVVEIPGRCVAHAGAVRPLKSRAEIGHARGGLGTLGLIVRKVGTAPALALSCSHVIARSGALADFGRSVEQPTGDLGETVGTLTDDFSTLRSGSLATADVALARLNIAVATGIVGSTVVPRAFAREAAGDFIVGRKTILFGGVTNQARGRIAAFESTWDIAEMPFVTGHVEFTGLVAYETRSAKGDSGGVVMSGQAGEEDVVIGIHTAGRSDGKLGLFQPIGPIMSRLGLELMT
ncbi:MAG TPA: hypothetical protein VFJ02_07770 [Vicinamibacterales bacterium]|nr:hypothetical protein [Vicinamibacterales bacterium]